MNLHGILQTWRFELIFPKEKNEITDDQEMEIMTQIAEGVQYLHSRNVIHRDIKPVNILIANDNPIDVKLTDFDLSKFLPEDVDTSKMSSNVGTEKFKAPEMFLRNEGKLAYYRNVDIYSTGLTYLAMLQETNPLLPRLETPQDDSEIQNSIGSTIANRIRRRKRSLTLDVVAVDKEKGFLSRKLCSLRRSSVTSDDQIPNHQIYLFL